MKEFTARVRKNKFCWFCKPIIKADKDDCVYFECPSCGKRIVEYNDKNKVRWNWLSGKIDTVKRSSVKEKANAE